MCDSVCNYFVCSTQRFSERWGSGKHYCVCLCVFSCLSVYVCMYLCMSVYVSACPWMYVDWTMLSILRKNRRWRRGRRRKEGRRAVASASATSSPSIHSVGRCGCVGLRACNFRLHLQLRWFEACFDDPSHHPSFGVPFFFPHPSGYFADLFAVSLYFVRNFVTEEISDFRLETEWTHVGDVQQFYGFHTILYFLAGKTNSARSCPAFLRFFWKFLEMFLQAGCFSFRR